MQAFLPNLPLIPTRASQQRKACLVQQVPQRPMRMAAASGPRLPDASTPVPGDDEPPVASRETAKPDCLKCTGAGRIACVACNGFGFTPVNGDTDWRTCHECVARGAIPCPECQPANAVLEIEDLPPITPPKS